MYLLKITARSSLIIDGEHYRFMHGGTSDEGEFLGTFVNNDGHEIEIVTPEGGGISIDDTIRNLSRLLTRRTL